MSTTPKTSFSQTLGPNGTFVRNWCETEPAIHEVKYVWGIHNYNFYKTNLSKGESLKSPVFVGPTDEGCKWYIELSPNGMKKSTTNHGALYLCLDLMTKYDSVMAKFKFSILDENLEEVKVMQDGRMSKFERFSSSQWGYENVIENYDFQSSSDKLTIYCEIQFSVPDHITGTPGESKSAAKLDSNVPDVGLSDDFGQLFNNDEFSDLTISVDQKIFKVHKLILSVRSPAFAELFKLKGSRVKKVIISDFDEQTVEEMLKYIYTGKSGNLNKLADKLLLIAERYRLKGLKDMSARAIVGSLTLKNAIDMLLFADSHGAHKLKAEIIDFIVKRSALVMKTTAWKNIVTSHPQLVVEVCEALSN